MKKYIVGISGSPRKDGNTDRAVKYCIEALSGKEKLEHVFIRACESDIRPCLGCRFCMKKKDCVIQGDDFRRIFKLIEESAFAVIGSPVYWLGPPGQMKNFIDRTHAYFARPETIRPSSAAGIVSIAADSGFPEHENIIKSWLDYYGFKTSGAVRLYLREKTDFALYPDLTSSLDELVEKLRKDSPSGQKMPSRL